MSRLSDKQEDTSNMGLLSLQLAEVALQCNSKVTAQLQDAQCPMHT